MKIIRTVAGMSLLWSALVSVALPGINCGSKESGFIVNNNATLNLSGLALNGMYLRSLGGDIVSVGTNRCDNVTLETVSAIKSSVYTFDGQVELGDSITLGDNDRLLLKGGLIMPVVVDNESYSVIEGYGQFSGTLTIEGGSALVIGMQSPVNVSIHANDTAATMILASDLTLAPGVAFTGSPMPIMFGNYRLIMGGNTNLTVDQAWIDASVELDGSVSLATNKIISFESSEAEPVVGGILNGGGNTFTFGSGATLFNDGVVSSLNSIVLQNTVSGCLSGTAAWNLDEVTFEHGTNSVEVSGVISSPAESGAVDIFGLSDGVTNFGSASVVRLNKDLVLGGVWSLDVSCSLNGNNYLCDLSGGGFDLQGSVSLADISLINMSDNSVSNTEGEGGFPLYLSNVEWGAAGNRIRINPFASSTQGAACYVYGGNIFNTQTSWWAGATIELLTDVALTNATWESYGSGLVIEGRGNILDLDTGTLTNGADVTLRNMVLANVKGSSFSGSGTYRLSNVVVKLAESVDFSESSMNFVIDGPVTIITGDYTFRVGGFSTIEGVTVYYDTLNGHNSNNVTGFTLESNGRLLFVEPKNPDNLTVIATSNSTVYLTRNEYLIAESAGISSNVASFSGAYTTTLDGLGRSLVFPANNEPVFSVATASTVVTTNVVLDGLVPQQLDGEGSLLFGDNTVIRLSKDWVLDRVLTFGSSVSATNEVLTLDLCGFTIDMSDLEAGLQLQGGAGQVLHINNGRLVNLSDIKLIDLNGESTHQLIFENIEFVLSADYYFYNAALEMRGHCVISGVSGSHFVNLSNNTFAIATGSTLTVRDGIVYEHLNSGDNFSMTDSSTFELIGSTLRWNRTGEITSLVLSTGRLIVDHKSALDSVGVGSHIVLSDSLDLQIRPSAMIEAIGGGTLQFQNAI